MSSRYEDRDYDRDEQDYGRRRESEYGRSSGERSRGRSGFRDENERYGGESRWRGQYGGSSASGRGRDYEGGREDYGSSGWEMNRDYTSDRDRNYGAAGQHYYGGQGSSAGQDWSSSQSYGTGQGYGQSYDRGQGYGRGQGSSRMGETSSGYSRRYDYPSDSPSRGRYGNQGGRSLDYDRSRYGREQEGGYDYERDRSGSGEERGWWDRASDAVASWFGDEEAERRRHMDEQRQQYRGRGPKGYRRSDDRIKEDVNDRLSEGYLDATEIEVSVQNAEVTLTGTVNSRRDKRQAEDIADSVTGVTNVENRLRVKQSGSEAYSSTGTGYSSTGTTETTTPTSTSSAAAGAGSTGTSGTTGTTGTSRSRT